MNKKTFTILLTLILLVICVMFLSQKSAKQDSLRVDKKNQVELAEVISPDSLLFSLNQQALAAVAISPKNADELVNSISSWIEEISKTNLWQTTISEQTDDLKKVWEPARALFKEYWNASSLIVLGLGPANIELRELEEDIKLPSLFFEATLDSSERAIKALKAIEDGLFQGKNENVLFDNKYQKEKISQYALRILFQVDKRGNRLPAILSAEDNRLKIFLGLQDSSEITTSKTKEKLVQTKNFRAVAGRTHKDPAVVYYAKLAELYKLLFGTLKKVSNSLDVEDAAKDEAYFKAITSTTEGFLAIGGSTWLKNGLEFQQCALAEKSSMSKKMLESFIGAPDESIGSIDFLKQINSRTIYASWFTRSPLLASFAFLESDSVKDYIKAQAKQNQPEELDKLLNYLDQAKAYSQDGAITSLGFIISGTGKLSVPNFVLSLSGKDRADEILADLQTFIEKIQNDLLGKAANIQITPEENHLRITISTAFSFLAKKISPHTITLSLAQHNNKTQENKTIQKIDTQNAISVFYLDLRASLEELSTVWTTIPQKGSSAEITPADIKEISQQLKPYIQIGNRFTQEKSGAYCGLHQSKLLP